MFVNESFWNNSNVITQELQMEVKSDDYITAYFSYINMLQTTYNLVIRGKRYFSTAGMSPKNHCGDEEDGRIGLSS